VPDTHLRDLAPLDINGCNSWKSGPVIGSRLAGNEPFNSTKIRWFVGAGAGLILTTRTENFVGDSAMASVKSLTR